MTKTFFTSFRKKVLFLFTLIFLVCSYNSNAQSKLQRAIEEAKRVREAAKAARDAAREIKNASKEINTTVKSLKTTWSKDTSSNIKYRQIPDYRSRDEVKISEKQKLKFENGKFNNVSWQPITNFDNQIFPSFVISWNSYKGTKNDNFGSSLGFNIRTNLKNIVFKWEIECIEKTYFNIDSGYISCDELLGSNFMPKISWNFTALSKQQISTPLSLVFRLIDPITKNTEEFTQKISLRSINDCLNSYNRVNYQNMYVAYINEDHPEIENIFKDAMNTKMISSISGYPDFREDMTKDEYLEAVKKIDLQVSAIWRVLHDRGFQYSSITNNSANETSGLLNTQTVRPFAMSIKTKQANCVDGSVMIASILKRMNYRTHLIVIPGHCFLGYSYDNGSQTFEKWRKEINPLGIFFLETTAMNNSTYLNKDSVTKNLARNIKPFYPARNFKTATEKDKEYFLQFLKVKDWGLENFFNNKGEVIDMSTVKFINVNNERINISPLPVE